MSRQTMADILVAEIYMATDHEPEDFRPMDPRRVKRFANIYESTWWNIAETVNRLAGAHLCSEEHRKGVRARTRRFHRQGLRKHREDRRSLLRADRAMAPLMKNGGRLDDSQMQAFLGRLVE